MKQETKVSNQKGATLLEAMIAVFILTIGILTVMVMQVRAIGSSSSAMNRTEANNVSLALLETFKELSFEDNNLDETNASLAELDAASTLQQLQALIAAGKVKTFTAAAFPEMQSLIQFPAGASAGTVIDHAGITYQLAWAVKNVTFDPNTGKTVGKNLRIFIFWNTPFGQNRLQMTTLKFRNTELL